MVTFAMKVAGVSKLEVPPRFLICILPRIVLALPFFLNILEPIAEQITCDKSDQFVQDLAVLSNGARLALKAMGKKGSCRKHTVHKVASDPKPKKRVTANVFVSKTDIKVGAKALKIISGRTVIVGEGDML